MNEDLELLNYIYQNAKMGITGINDIQKYIEDIDLKNYVLEQLSDYQKVCNEAIELLIQRGSKEKDINSFAKISSYIMANMKSMTDNSPSNLAKMLIEGSNKGIIEITKHLNEYQNISEEVKSLATNLLNIEEKNLDRLKKFP